MKKRKQHLIPNCYLKAWCDPTTPPGQEPYIWLHSVDTNERRRKSPRKTFTETDRYTIESSGGGRNLRIEDTLADIETKFVGIRDQLEGVRQIPATDHFLLCAFVAAMVSRTKPAGDHWGKVWSDLQSQARKIAQAHGSEVNAPQLNLSVHNAMASVVHFTIKVLAPMLFHLRSGIYYAESRGAFITSDNPCVWYDPDSLKRPPLLRSPALCYPNVKILLPLSPNSLLMLSYDKQYAGYFHASEQFIDEVNRLIRFNSHQHYITRDGRTKNLWSECARYPLTLGKTLRKAKLRWLSQSETGKCEKNGKPLDCESGNSKRTDPEIIIGRVTRACRRGFEFWVPHLSGFWKGGALDLYSRKTRTLRKARRMRHPKTKIDQPEFHWMRDAGSGRYVKHFDCEVLLWLWFELAGDGGIKAAELRYV